MTFLLLLINLVAVSCYLLGVIAETPTNDNGPQCEWKQQAEDAPEVYYINLDRSKQRKIDMEKHLQEAKLKYFRVRALTPKEFFIPQDVLNTWQNRHCILQTEWKPPAVVFKNNNTSENEEHQYNGQPFIMSSLCGRKKNTMKEIGCTASHLWAMKQAIESTTSKSRYAIILEDDVFFPFNIDFNALAASAPSGFGILQLFNSNYPTLKGTWNRYTQHHQHHQPLTSDDLWELRKVGAFDFWSTCAYLIDRHVMKAVVDQLVVPERLAPNVHEFKLTAGVSNPCTPHECCNQTNNGGIKFNFAPPCIYAPRGYQADSYLYAATTTYMMRIPIITNGMGGNSSTFHQQHVEMLHRKSFKLQRELVNEMLSAQVKIPTFIQPACKALDTEFL